MKGEGNGSLKVPSSTARKGSAWSTQGQLGGPPAWASSCAVLLASVLAAVLGACSAPKSFGDGSGEPGGCELGSADCFCLADATCAPGLACVQGRCVGESSSSGATSPEPGPGPGPEPGPEPGPGEDPQDSGSSDEEQLRCTDGQQNGQESDVDCGGRVCPGCSAGQACRVDLDCQSQVCLNQRCVAQDAPSCLQDSDCNDQNACTHDVCQRSRCQFSPLADDSPCDDANPCTASDRCRQGLCEGQDTLVVDETFSDPSQTVFDLDFRPPVSLWQAATAKASDCSSSDWGEDPAQDHTQDGANGVMGVVVGGCNDRRNHTHEQDCAWTRYIDVSSFEQDLHLSFWRHIATPGSRSRILGIRVKNHQYYRLEGDDEVYTLKRGWPKGLKDTEWTLDQSYIPLKDISAPISFGICYQRVKGSGSFAGWSVDDFKVRQRGCEPEQ